MYAMKKVNVKLPKFPKDLKTTKVEMKDIYGGRKRPGRA